jgi:hypothetical protein
MLKQKKKTLFLNASYNTLLLINYLALNIYIVGIIKIINTKIVVYNSNYNPFTKV